MFILITDFGSSKSTVSSQSLSGKYLGQEPPVMKAEIFAQGIISTDSFEHSSPNFSPDGNEIYWTQLTAEHGSEAIVKFVTKINGVWSSPQKATFLGGYDDMYPTFSHDGNKIYFSLMNQYSPKYLKPGFEYLNHRVSNEEYKEVVDHVLGLGFVNGYIQEFLGFDDEFLPDFNNKSVFGNR